MKKEKGQTFCDTSLNHCPFRFYGFRRRQRTERVLYHADCNRRPTHHLKGLCPLHSRILALLHHSAEKIARSGINDPHRLRSSQQIIRCSSDGKGTGISRHVAQSLSLSILCLLQTATYRTCPVPCRLHHRPTHHLKGLCPLHSRIIIPLLRRSAFERGFSPASLLFPALLFRSVSERRMDRADLDAPVPNLWACSVTG